MYAHQLDFLKKTKTLIPVQTEALQKDLRPRHESIRQSESKSAMSISVQMLFGKVFEKRDQKWTTQK